MATQKALVLKQYGKRPKLEQWPVPQLQAGQILVEVEGSTINPSDRMLIEGKYFPIPLPYPAGLEGVGKVVKVNGQNVQEWQGKRVCFCGAGGAWSEYIALNPATTTIFQIDNDVELSSASSGIVNPLTVVGMIHVFQNIKGCKGIIHTAAASALGRMLNRRCQTLGIPLLNIVRREEQADLLIKEGAKHVIITKGEWNDGYKNAIKQHGFNVVFDALGGGDVISTIIDHLGPNSHVHVYGKLDEKPFQLNAPYLLGRGVNITGFMMPAWYAQLSAEDKKPIQKEYSSLLKKELKTQVFKIMTFDQIDDAMRMSVENALEGKITLVPKK